MTFADLLDLLVESSSIKPQFDGGSHSNSAAVIDFLVLSARSCIVGVCSSLLSSDPAVGFEVEVDGMYDSAAEKFITDVSVIVYGSQDAAEGMFLLSYGFTYYEDSRCYSISLVHKMSEIAKLL